VNPYDPPTVVGELSLPTNPHARSKWLRISAGLYAFVLLAGVVVSAYHIASIMVSGPALLVSGAFFAYMGYRNALTTAVVLGLSSLILAAVVIGLINLVPYSPRSGQWPLFGVCCVYSLIVLPLTLRVCLQRFSFDG
jgi:hypothetical protein